MKMKNVHFLGFVSIKGLFYINNKKEVIEILFEEVQLE
jgi:hypothetical protein